MVARPLAIPILFLLAVAGCTSLLGDYSVGSAPQPAGDAAADTGGPAADGAADGGAPDSGAAPKLACDGFSHQQPVMLASLQGSATPLFERGMALHQAGQGIARIIARPAQSSDYLVYTLRPNDPNPKPRTTTVHTQGGWVQAIRRTRSGTAVLTAERNAGDSSMFLAVRTFPDSFDGQPGTPLPPLVPLTPPNSINPNYLRSDFLELGPSDWFVVAFNNDRQGGTIRQLAVARVQGAPAAPRVIFTPQGDDSMASGALVEAAGTAYIFIGPDGPPSGTQGARVLTTPADGMGQASAPRDLRGTGKALLLAGAQASVTSAGKINMAVAEVDLQAAKGIFVVRDGQLDPAGLGRFTGPDLRAVKSIDDAADVPAGEGGGGWVDDDFVLAAGPPTGGGGLNFLWVDAQANLRGEAMGAQRLMPARFPVGSAITVGEKLGTRFARFWLAWTEKEADDAGAYHTLYLNELNCH